MNVWIFNHYAVTPDMPGSTRHYDLAKQLLCKGHNVTIFASSFHHNLHREMKLLRREWWKVENVDGVKLVWIKTFPYQKNDWRRVINMLSYMVRAYRLGRKITKIAPVVPEPDIIIGSSVHPLAVVAAYCVAKHYKAKFLMEVRDLWPQTLIDMGALSEHSPLTKILRALEKFLYHRASRIITVPPLTTEYIGKLNVSKEKIVWVPNGVELSRFSYTEAQASDKYFKVIYCGAHGPNDGLDVILDAAKIVQDKGYISIKFIFVGDGQDKPRLVAKSKEMGLENVEFHQPLPKVKIPDIIRQCDAGIFVLKDLPLYKYGFSANKIFDYMAAGKPIIMAGNPVNNIVNDATCGLTVPPEDPEALAEALIRLYKMPKEEREAMGRRGREYVEKHHAIPVLADKLERVLQEVVGEA